MRPGLVQPLTHKAEFVGREGVLVDPNGTWQRCSGYAALVNEKSFCLRVYACPGSGLESDHDKNAPINILTLELQDLGIAPRSHPAGGVE